MLSKVKLALRVTGTAFDSQLNDLIDAAHADLGITGALFFPDSSTKRVDALVDQAVITYCGLNFGEPDDYERLKASYDEQKAQIRCNPKYAANVH